MYFPLIAKPDILHLSKAKLGFLKGRGRIYVNAINHKYNRSNLLCMCQEISISCSIEWIIPLKMKWDVRPGAGRAAIPSSPSSAASSGTSAAQSASSLHSQPTESISTLGSTRALETSLCNNKNLKNSLQRLHSFQSYKY